jgi:hypothetical protein
MSARKKGLQGIRSRPPKKAPKLRLTLDRDISASASPLRTIADVRVVDERSTDPENLQKATNEGRKLVMRDQDGRKFKLQQIQSGVVIVRAHDSATETALIQSWVLHHQEIGWAPGTPGAFERAEIGLERWTLERMLPSGHVIRLVFKPPRERKQR